MRFCGMCGMPLPHRPLTAPGAQSTLNFTRVPVESHTARQEPAAASTASSTVVVTDAIADEDNAPARIEEPNVTAPAAETVELPATAPETPKELAPDVPFDEYLQSFRYHPPTEPTEVTMRGERHMAEPALAVETPVLSQSDTETVVPTDRPVLSQSATEAVASADAVISSTASETVPPAESTTAVSADTDKRLGLEPQGPEAPAERPRFLDLREPPRETKAPAAAGTSTIVGPSFLGLSDAPEVAGASVSDQVQEPARSHWRAWLAVAVVVIFAALGVLEWRSQVNQSYNGPVEVMKAKIRNWGHRAAPPPEPAAPSSADNDSKPDIQVQPLNQPATPPPSNANSNANANESAQTPAASAPATPAPTVPPATQNSAANSQPADNGTPTPAAPTATAKNTARPPQAEANQAAPSAVAKSAPLEKPSAAIEKTMPARKAKPNNPELPAKQAMAGADEMARAKNASDSAATAAWLWKATAKGNPDAPVQLADMYIKGDGVPRSCEQAVVLLKTAAAKENTRARNRLAFMYANGECVQRNRVEAYRWFSSALTANPNNEWAQQNRDLLWRQMTPDERVMAEKYR